jgi:peptidoglycan LD-endopeptidase LytH
MKRTQRGATWRLAAIVGAFCAGALVDSYLRVHGPPLPAAMTHPGARAPEDDGAAAAPGAPAVVDANEPTEPHVAATTGHARLTMPLEGVEAEQMKGGFLERRDGHAHEAVDLLAPRNTPVHAVEDGSIAKLFFSRAGGNTIYQFDPGGRRAYYYAHLERYAGGLHEGDGVRRGQVIGYVGTSGNAPANTPHLHFAVFELNADRHWWQGRAIDPYPLFKGSS